MSCRSPILGMLNRQSRNQTGKRIHRRAAEAQSFEIGTVTLRDSHGWEGWRAEVAEGIPRSILPKRQQLNYVGTYGRGSARRDGCYRESEGAEVA